MKTDKTSDLADYPYVGRLIALGYPMAMRRGGLAGGYVARLGDLVNRRMRDLMPTGRRRRVVASAVEDMADRLRLERWLKTQEK